MLKQIALNSSLLIGLSSIVLAQSPADKADQIEKQVPTNKEGIENGIQTAQKIVQPAISEKLKKMREQALLVTANNIQFHKDVKDGKSIPFSDLKRRYIEEFPGTLHSLSKDYHKILSETRPATRKSLTIAFQKALRPIAPYLSSSEYGNADMSLTKKQHTELVRLQKLDPRTQIGAPGLPELLTQGDTHTYTMLHLPVYMQLKAQPGASVFFSTNAGGEFSNGLNMQEIKANDKGIAEAQWVSKGDAVGLAIINVASPQSSNPAFFRIETLGLKLKALPQLVEVKPTPESLKNKIKSSAPTLLKESLKSKQAETPEKQ